MLTIFELEEGIMYHCNFYGESVIFKRDSNRLMTSAGKDWVEHTTITSSWRFTEIEGQRNLCPDCKRAMQFVKNCFYINIHPMKWYSGYYCDDCGNSHENKDDPLPKFYTRGKSI